MIECRGARDDVLARARSHAHDVYDHMMLGPRFVVSSAEELEALARTADPPVEPGQRAQIVKHDRVVVLEVARITPLVEWIEVRT